MSTSRLFNFKPQCASKSNQLFFLQFLRSSKFVKTRNLTIDFFSLVGEIRVNRRGHGRSGDARALHLPQRADCGRPRRSSGRHQRLQVYSTFLNQLHQRLNFSINITLQHLWLLLVCAIVHHVILSSNLLQKNHYLFLNLENIFG